MQVLLEAWYVCILLASLARVSSLEVGRRYRIRIANVINGQPAGWYLDAHRSLASDRENSGLSRVSVHKETNAYWAGEWIFEQSSSPDTYKIKLMSSHQGQEQGWYLDSSPSIGVVGRSWRNSKSAWVFVQTSNGTDYNLIMDWTVRQATGVTIGGVTVPTYTLQESPGWYLSARRDIAADSRSATSTFAMVQGDADTTTTSTTTTKNGSNSSNQTSQSQTQSVGRTEWLLESVCSPLCAYDEGEGGCHVNRKYTADVVRVLQGGTWSSITDHLLDCEAKGKIDLNACLATPGCELDSRGRCAASNTWSFDTLVSLPSNSGLGIGEYQKCGLFGQYINLSVSCAFNKQEDVCKAKNTGGNSVCVWDDIDATCEASPAAIQRFLIQNYREELGYVALRRLRCEAKTVATCGGDCEWSEGRCTLHPIRSLLAVLGQACPLSHFFKRQTECTRTGDQATCVSRMGVGGMAQCRWTNTTCEAYAISLELDILPSLGLESSVPRKLLEGSQQCRAMTQDLECTATCAPTITAYPEQESGVANQRVQTLTIMLCILFSMVKLL